MDIIHTKSVAADLEYYENSRYYDVLHRAQQEAPYRPSRIVGDLVLLGQSVVTLVAVLGLIMSLHWTLGLIIVVAAIPGAIVRTRYSNTLFRWQWRRTMTERVVVVLPPAADRRSAPRSCACSTWGRCSVNALSRPAPGAASRTPAARRPPCDR